MNKKLPDRIKFEDWINSQFSIVKYYGACIIDGSRYELDYENCRKTLNENGEENFFPDLVKVGK